MTAAGRAALPPAVQAQAWRTVRIVVPYERAAPEAESSPARAYAFQGTGFLLVRGLIRPLGYVVTCAHVLHNIRGRYGPDAPVRVVLATGHARSLHLLELDDAHDLAVLQLSGALAGLKDAPSTALPRKLTGREVFALGYAEADTGSLWTAAGSVVQRGRYAPTAGGVAPDECDGQQSASALILDGIIPLPGTSGSPLFAADGTLLGYLKGSLTDGRALALTIERVWEVLGAT